MRKLKLLIAACALLLGAGQAGAQTDVTLTNAGFDNCTAETSDVAAKTIKDYSASGWTNASKGDFTTIAVTSYGSGTKVGGSTTPSTKKDGTTVSGNTLGIIAGWGDAVTLQSGEISLPAGVYTLTVDHYLTSSTSNYGNSSSRFGFVTSSASYLVSNTAFTASTWTTETVTFTLTESTNGKIQIGLKGNDKSGSGSPAVFYDDVTITWTDPLQASKEALQAEIDKASLCDAKEGLADAIAAAESVLASATTVAALEEALATLQAADKDAVLRYENGLTDATATAPIATNFVINGTFDSGISPWQRTGTYQNNKTANNQEGAFTGNFYENWNGDAQANKMYQTITNIPNGTYRLDIAAFVNTLVADPNESQYVFANNDKVYLTTGDPTAYEVYTVVTNNQIEVGLEQTTATANWMGIDNVSLRYYGPGDVINDAKNAAHKLAWLEAKAAAEAALGNTAYANVTGSEKTAVETEVGKAEPTTAEGYDAAAEDLNTATAAFIAAAPSYDAYAEAAGIAATLEATSVTAPTTAAEAVTRTQELYVNIDTKVKTTYANNITEEYPGSFEGTFTSTNKGQHWSDNGNTTYLDNWGSGVISTTRDITLPAGKYLLKTAGRGSVDAVTHKLYMSANGTTVNFPNNGDTGKGIDVNGAVNYGEGTFANNNIGRGWEWRFIPVTLTEETTVTVTLTMERSGGNTWGSFSDFTILCDDATYTAAQKAAIVQELKALLAEGDALVEKYKYNYGDGVFQIPTTAYSTFKGKVATGHTFDNETAIAGVTVELLKQAKERVESGIAAFKATELNSPAEGKLYNLVVATENHPKIGNAVIIIPGATGNNNPTGYGMNANFAINPNLNQAVTFTKVSGNNYNISFTTAGGTTYLTYGTLNGSAAGWKNSQIQATTDAEKKGEFLIAASATANAFNIINTITNSTIACQTGGNIYTEDGNADFKLVEAATPSITINTNAAGWGTVMLPFDGLEVPANVKAYTCAATEGATLTLEEVSALEVNKPYIIEGAWEETITDFKAQGAALEYTEGLLTGVYSKGTVPSGKYVMQKKNDKVAFYKVGDNQPTIYPNHAYLNAPSGNAREAFFFFDDETTGIQAIDALMNGDATIFDASGAQMPSLKKGMNIIRRADGSTYKVIVK